MVGFVEEQPLYTVTVTLSVHDLTTCKAVVASVGRCDLIVAGVFT